MRTFSSLIGRSVVTESGLSLGRLHDLRCELTASRLEVVALCVGQRGWFARLGIRSRPGGEIDWASVIRVEGQRVIVRDP